MISKVVERDHQLLFLKLCHNCHKITSILYLYFGPFDPKNNLYRTIQAISCNFYMWFFTVTQHPIRVQQTHKYSKPTKVCHWSVRIKISFDLKFLKVFNLAKIVTNHPQKKEKGLFEGNQWVGAVGVGLLNSHEGWVEVGAGQKFFHQAGKFLFNTFWTRFFFT